MDYPKTLKGFSFKIKVSSQFPIKKCDPNNWTTLLCFIYLTTSAQRAHKVGCASLVPTVSEIVQQRSHFSPSAFSTTTEACSNTKLFADASDGARLIQI